MTTELNVAVAAVREAARLCRAVRARLAEGVLDKADRSPVTVADYGSQALVCRALGEAFPDDPVVGEEDAGLLRRPEHAAVLGRVVEAVQAVRPGADAASVCAWIDRGGARDYRERFWTLDPIDGTKGFLRGDQYAVALALVVGGEVEVAALACPALGPDPLAPSAGGAVYAAVRGRGAFELPLDPPAGGGDDAPVPVRASPEADPARARYCASVEPEHSALDVAAAAAARLGLTAPPLRVDSQVKYALLARGDAELYLRLPRGTGYVEKIWDHAAGALLVAEAGGTVTDVHGRPLDFRHGRGLSRNDGVVASNGLLHDAVLAAVRAVS